MTESTPEHQDPSEQYQTDTEVETNDAELKHGGEMIVTSTGEVEDTKSPPAKAWSPLDEV